MNKMIQIGTPMLVNSGVWKHRLMVGTPVTGNVRIEWVQKRYNQVIPTNWSLLESLQFLNSTMPLRFQVSDAQNLCVKAAIEHDVEWLWLLEHDNVLPDGAFLIINKYMREKKVPVMSGLYFTKSHPPEPLLYRGSGNSFYTDWKLGDKVWVDGIPTGCILIHMSLLKTMWNDSPEYKLQTPNGTVVVRRVFQEPAKMYIDIENGLMRTETGTSDLAWCKRVIEEKYFERSGWPKFQKMKHPFLVDTNLYTTHIDPEGRQFPLGFPQEYMPEPKKK